MKRLGLIILILYAALVTGLATATFARGQASSGPYIVLDADGTWHYAEQIEPTVEVAPATATAAIEPTATALPLCGGTVTVDGLNVRSAPRGPIVTTYAAGTHIGIDAGVWHNNNGTWELWYQSTVNRVTIYVYAGLIKLDDQAVCNFPSEPKAARLFGLHLTVGASADVVYAALPRVGSLKGTDGTEGILIGARRLRPDLIIVYRALNGGQDCPPGWAVADPAWVADSWWTRQLTLWRARGLIGIVDYFEVINECIFPGSAWERDFWITTMQHANDAGICLALFGDAYGNPQIHEFQSRTPILDYLLAHTCQPGRRHVVAMHSYEGAASGEYKFGRWRLVWTALGSKYDAVRILFTEYAYGTGRPPVNCAALWADWAAAERAYRADGRVIGAQYFNVSPVGEWGDISPCLK